MQLLKRAHELFHGDLSLTQQASKRAELEFGVHWDDAALATAPSYNVATGLPDALKAQFLKRLERLSTRYTGQLRHALAAKTSSKRGGHGRLAETHPKKVP